MSGHDTPTPTDEKATLDSTGVAEAEEAERVEVEADTDLAANQAESPNDAADEVFSTPNSSVRANFRPLLPTTMVHVSLQPPLSAFDAAGRVKNLQLHSPSHIVGTPFTGESSSTSSSSTRFEYPFPISSLSSPTNSPPSNALSPAYPSHHVSPAPPALELPYTPAHPKLRTNPPPIPPGLLKKKRWSLTAGFLPLLQRRNSGSQSSSTSASSRPATTTNSPKHGRQGIQDGDTT